MLRAGLTALFCCAFIGAAQAQNNGQDSSAIAVPPPPPITATPTVITPEPLPPPAQPAPPGLVETPVPPVNADNGAPAAAGAPAAPPAPPANNWVPGKTATLGVLDKIDGTVTQITIPAGGQSNIGDLQVSVQACLIRPPDEIPDAAVFLTAQNTATAGAAPLYRGWMVRSVPGAAVVGDASEIFRVIGCS